MSRVSGLTSKVRLDFYFLPLTLFIFLLVCGKTTSQQSCPEEKNITYLTVLPGKGWDNLRNLEMLNILQNNFSLCRKTLDEMYYIPDDVEIIPKMSSKMEAFSEIFTNYQNYKSMRYSSVNVDASASFFGVSLGGSFSDEHQSVRVSQINSQSITTRVQLRQNLFTILSGQSPLTPAFRDRLLDIGFQLHSNETTQAAYLADMLVADYGTHVLTRVDAGGIIWKLDSIKTDSRELSTSQRTSICASASVGFSSIFKVSVGTNNTSTDSSDKQYHHNLTNQRIGSHGGMPVKPGQGLDEWSASLPRKLVAIDVDGDSISNVISPLYLGDTIPYQLIGQINGAVKQAIERYYYANAVIGCMEPGAKNFEPNANIPSTDCKLPKSNFTLGGFFQTCVGASDLCNGHTVPNFITGGPSCPGGFYPVLLQTRMFATRKRCSTSWWHTSCNTDSATYYMYWCAAKSQSIRRESGFLLGGIYTKKSTNPMTKAHSCPPHYLSVTFGAGDISICLSRDFELASDREVDFGGFFSCHAGNPYNVLPTGEVNAHTLLTVRSSLNKGGPSKWPQRCPHGYAQHMGFIDAGCEMMYCMRAGQLKQVEEQRVKRPPFILLPEGSVPKPRIDQGLHLDVSTGTYVNQEAMWHKERSKWQTAVGVLGSLLCTVCVATLIAAVILIRRKRNVTVAQMNYQQLEGEVQENQQQHEIDEVCVQG